MKMALVITPTRRASCCRQGVPPTKKAVFKSWEMVPPLEAAMPTMAAVVSAINWSEADVQPRARKIKQVSSSVATTIPEIGLDDDPISPVIRALTVAKKKLQSTISNAETRLI